MQTNIEYKIWTKATKDADNIFYSRCYKHEIEIVLKELRNKGYKYYRIDYIETTEGMFKEL